MSINDPYFHRPYFIETITTDTAPYKINIKPSVVPISAESMDKVPDKVIEYINKAIQTNWDGDKAKINAEIVKSETKFSVNYQKIHDLFANYGWDVDYRTVDSNEWFVFTIRK